MQVKDHEGKTFFSLVTVTGSFPLGFEARWLWSKLRWCAESGITESAMSRVTPTSVRVPSALSALMQYDLATCEGGMYFPVEPTGKRSSWFCWQNNKKHCYRRLAYVACYIPADDAPVSLRQSVLYYTLAAMASADGLALGKGDQ
jgi:hypothetical protein